MNKINTKQRKWKVLDLIYTLFCFRLNMTERLRPTRLVLPTRHTFKLKLEVSSIYNILSLCIIILCIPVPYLVYLCPCIPVLYPCIPVSLYFVSLYPSIPVSMYPCIHVSLYPCIPVSLYPCILVILYPCNLVSLYPCILVYAGAPVIEDPQELPPQNLSRGGKVTERRIDIQPAEDEDDPDDGLRYCDIFLNNKLDSKSIQFQGWKPILGLMLTKIQRKIKELSE